VSGGRRLELFAVALGIAGAGLMIGFEETITRILGVAALLGFVAVGLVAIANPVFLADSGEEDDRREGRV